MTINDRAGGISKLFDCIGELQDIIDWYGETAKTAIALLAAENITAEYVVEESGLPKNYTQIFNDILNDPLVRLD